MTITIAKSSAEAIRQVFSVYGSSEDIILDPTVGIGKFWVDYPCKVITSDILPTGMIRADFRNLPFMDEQFDGAVFDPPYFGHGAEIQSSSILKSDHAARVIHKTEPIRNLYMKGLLELSRVVKNKGIIVVKCTDGCDYPRMGDWIAGLRIGQFKDVVICTNLSLRNFRSIKSPRKKLRTCHSYFIVLQNSYYGRSLG